jgi:hypothetical protein
LARDRQIHRHDSPFPSGEEQGQSDSTISSICESSFQHMQEYTHIEPHGRMHTRAELASAAGCLPRSAQRAWQNRRPRLDAAVRFAASIICVALISRSGPVLVRAWRSGASSTAKIGVEMPSKHNSRPAEDAPTAAHRTSHNLCFESGASLLRGGPPYPSCYHSVHISSHVSCLHTSCSRGSRRHYRSRSHRPCRCWPRRSRAGLIGCRVAAGLLESCYFRCNIVML